MTFLQSLLSGAAMIQAGAVEFSRVPMVCCRKGCEQPATRLKT